VAKSLAETTITRRVDVGTRPDIVRNGKTYRFVTNVKESQQPDENRLLLEEWERRLEGEDILIEDDAAYSDGRPLPGFKAIYRAI
jgi:hypothetical protein